MPPSADQQEPCLVVKHDNPLNPNVFNVSLASLGLSTKWDGMVSKPTIHVRRGDNRRIGFLDEDKEMFKFALALKSHQCLEAIHFEGCCINDLSHIYLATTTAIKPKERLTLQFKRCSFEHRAAKTLQFMLEDDFIHELVFQHCDFDEGSAKAIQLGLSTNQSLRKFECLFDEDSSTEASPINGVQEMLNNNCEIEKLNLTVKDDDGFWGGFRYAMDNNSLESLCFQATEIDIKAMEGILVKCFTMNSLTELGFCNCIMTESAMKLMVKTLSTGCQILDTLILDHVTMLSSDSSLETACCGRMKVSNIYFMGTPVCDNEEEFEAMMEDFSNNAITKCLDLSNCFMGSNETYEDICNQIILPNRGPTELILDINSEVANEVTMAFQQNSSVTSLTIQGSDDGCLYVFAEGVATMTGLRKLSFRLLHESKDEGLENFFQALEYSLEENTTLQTLTLSGSDPNLAVAQRYLPNIRYFLAINRIGRERVFIETIPLGLWANILAKTSKEADAINFVMRGKPEIVAQSRKRKERDDDS